MPPNKLPPGVENSFESRLPDSTNSVDDNDNNIITGVLFEQDADTIDGGLTEDIEKFKTAGNRKLELVWINIITYGSLHVAAVYGAYLILTSAMWQTIVCGVLFEQDAQTVDGGLTKNIGKYKKAERRKLELVWHNILSFGFLHVAALYGAYLLCTSAKWQTMVFAFAWYIMAGLGVTAGSHRLWSHRAYKAKWPLRVILIIFNAMASQNTIYHWVRDHRVHHKYSDTDADPHNSTRGFFFSHIGWLLCRKHPEVQAKGNGIDLSDLKADPIVMFQKKYYGILMPLACFIVPTLLPMWLWSESLLNSWFGGTLLRWCVQLNVTFLLNSAAHKFGDKPYDKHISPTQMPSLFTLSLGEGWHNYHHAFPWDYKSDEFGNFSLNLTASFIDFFAKIGWAYDLKTVPSSTIKQRMQRTGDGSHATWG